MTKRDRREVRRVGINERLQSRGGVIMAPWVNDAIERTVPAIHDPIGIPVPSSSRHVVSASSWPPSWWGETSLSPTMKAKATCDHCGREPWMGRPLAKVGRGQRVCIDCFCFLSGIDPRDPTIERTARSGDPAYLTVDEWHAAGEPSVPMEPERPKAGKPWVANHNTWLDRILDFLGVW